MKKAGKFWYYKEVTNNDTRTLTGATPDPGKRTKIPSKRFQQYLTGQALAGAYLDIQNEDSKSDDLNSSLSQLLSAMPTSTENPPEIETANLIMNRLNRCREIVKYMKKATVKLNDS